MAQRAGGAAGRGPDRPTTDEASPDQAATPSPLTGPADLLVASKLRQVIRGHDMRMSADFAEELNGYVHALVERAARRARDNGRATIRVEDL